MTKGHRITRVITKQPALSFELCFFSVPSSSTFSVSCFYLFGECSPTPIIFFACFRYSRLLLRRIFLLRNAVLASVALYRPSYTYIYACRLYTSGCVCILQFFFFFVFVSFMLSSFPLEVSVFLALSWVFRLTIAHTLELSSADALSSHPE